MSATHPGPAPNPLVIKPTDTPKELDFKSSILAIITRHTYVFNYRSRFKVNQLETMGVDIDSVRNEIIRWCNQRGFKFITVHPKYVDLSKGPAADIIDEVHQIGTEN